MTLGLLALLILSIQAPGVASAAPATSGRTATSSPPTSVSAFSLNEKALSHPADVSPAPRALENRLASPSTTYGPRPRAAFSTPIQVSTTTTADQNGGPVFADYNNPASVTDAAGYIWTAWSANVSGRWGIFFADSSNGGASFSTPVQLDSGAATQDTEPSIAVYGSGASADIAVVWETRAADTIEPASSDGYVLEVSFGGGGSWSQIGTQADFATAFPSLGAVTYIEAPVVSWTDSGNVLIDMWAVNANFAEDEDWPTTTFLLNVGYTSGTTFCSSATCDGGWGFEGPTSTTAYYTALLATACSPSTTDCGFVFSETNSGGTTTYSRIWYDLNNFYTASTGAQPTEATITTFTGSTAGDAAILLTQGGMAYSTGADGMFVEEVQTGGVFSFDVWYYYTSTSWSAHTLGGYPTGSASTTGTLGAVVAANPSTGGPYVSWIDSSYNIDATWAPTAGGTFLTPIVVSAGGVYSATAIGVTTAASPSPFRVDVSFIDGESNPQVMYSNFLGLYATASASPTTVDLWESVSFTSTPGAGAPAYTYAWSFGGACSPSCPTTVQNPVVNYTSAGSYTVSLTVTDSIGETAKVAVGTITVNPLLVVTIAPATGAVDSGQSVTFTATASGGSGIYGANAYAWKLNGATQAATTATFTTTFTTQGTDTISVTVTDSLPWTSRPAYSIITVDAPLLLSSISASPNPVAPGSLVTFTATASGGTTPYTYAWTLHGTTSSQSVASPTNTYATAGNYTIYLNLTDSSTGTPAAAGAATMFLLVDTPMTASASVWPGAPLAGVSTLLNATVTGGTPAYVYSWTFGDGTSSGPTAKASTPHIYAAPGTYVAHLFVNDSFGLLAKASVTFTVDAALVVSASSTPNPSTVSSSVSFTGTAAGGSGGYIWSWDFGDGSSLGTTQNPTHTYTAAGSYSVVLTVKDSMGHVASSNPINQVVQTAGGGGLAVTMTAFPSQADVGTPVTFNATVNGGTPSYSYTWDFGDGTSPSAGSASSISHSYATQGTYTATVTVTDSASHTGSASVQVTILAAGTLTASITATRISADVNESITFKATAAGGSGTFTTFLFNFGDGQTASVPVTGGATTESTSHAYTAMGSYSPFVTVTDSASVQVSSAPVGISVDPALTVAITAPTTSADIGVNVVFSANPAGGAAPYTQYEWRFGAAGSFSPGSQQQGNTFTADGSPQIAVEVTDNNGETATGFLTYTVNAPLVASVTGSPNDQPAPLCVTFTVTAQGGAGSYSYAWQFGDGSSALTNNASWTHCYAGQPGLYNASVQVTDAVGGKVAAWVAMTVAPPSTPSGVGAILGSWWWILLVIIAVAAVVLFVVLRRRKPQQAPEDFAFAGGGAMVVGGGMAAAGVGGEGIAPMVPAGASDQSPDELGGVLDAPAGASVGPAQALPAGSEVSAMAQPSSSGMLPACPRCGSALMGEGLPCPNCQYVAQPGETAAVGVGASMAASAPSAGVAPSSELTHCPQCAGPLAPDNSCPVCQVRWEPSATSMGSTTAAGVPGQGPSPSTPLATPQGPAQELTHCPQCGTTLNPGRVCPKCQVSWEPHAKPPADLSATGSAAPSASAPTTAAPEESFPVPPPPVVSEVRRDGSSSTSASATPAAAPSVPEPPAAAAPPPVPSAPPVPAAPPAPSALAPPPPEARRPPAPLPMAMIPATTAGEPGPTGGRTRCFICDGPLENGFCSTCNMSWSD